MFIFICIGTVSAMNIHRGSYHGQLPIGSRTTAMGGAGSALGGRCVALQWNPAGLTQIHRMQAYFSWAPTTMNRTISYSSFALRTNRAVFAGSFSGMFIKGIKENNAAGETLSTFTGSDTAVSLGYGFIFTNVNISLGASLRLLYQHYLQYGGIGVSPLNLGVQWKCAPRWTLGISGTDIYNKITWNSASHRTDAYRGVYRCGIALDTTGKNFAEKINNGQEGVRTTLAFDVCGRDDELRLDRFNNYGSIGGEVMFYLPPHERPPLPPKKKKNKQKKIRKRKELETLAQQTNRPRQGIRNLDELEVVEKEKQPKPPSPIGNLVTIALRTGYNTGKFTLGAGIGIVRVHKKNFKKITQQSYADINQWKIKRDRIRAERKAVREKLREEYRKMLEERENAARENRTTLLRNDEIIMNQAPIDIDRSPPIIVGTNTSAVQKSSRVSTETNSSQSNASLPGTHVKPGGAVGMPVIMPSGGETITTNTTAALPVSDEPHKQKASQKDANRIGSRPLFPFAMVEGAGRAYYIEYTLANDYLTRNSDNAHAGVNHYISIRIQF